MGTSQSYPGLTEDILDDYATLTYLNKGEVLHSSRASNESSSREVLSPYLLLPSSSNYCVPGLKDRRNAGEKSFKRQEKFYSIAPDKLNEDHNHRFSKEEILQKFDVLRNNPFQDRFFKVFSSKKDDYFSFEDLLDLASAMSPECPQDVKAEWAFRLYDLDEDNQISERDITEIIDRITCDPHCCNRYLDIESKKKIANIILEELKLDSTGSIGLIEFKIMMSRIPEFISSFYLRL